MAKDAWIYAKCEFKLGRKPLRVLQNCKRLGYKVNRSTVFRWFEQFQETGKVERKPGSGRKRAITGQLLSGLKKSSKKIPFSSKKWASAHSVLHKTVRRTLKRENMVPAVCPRKFMILPQNKPLRVKFGKSYRVKPLRWVRRNTDSNYFGIGNSGRVYCWVNKGTRPPVLPKAVQKGPKIHVYAAMNRAGTSAPIILTKESMNVDANRYIANILPKLVDFSYQSIGPNHVFMQDGAPAHRVKKTMDWIRNCPKLKEVLAHGVWPPQSPDLNPIENLWGYLVMKVDQKRPKNEKQLIRAVKYEFAHIPLDLCQKLVDSVPQRLQKVVQSKGEPINY